MHACIHTQIYILHIYIYLFIYIYIYIHEPGFAALWDAACTNIAWSCGSLGRRQHVLKQIQHTNLVLRLFGTQHVPILHGRVALWAAGSTYSAHEPGFAALWDAACTNIAWLCGSLGRRQHVQVLRDCAAHWAAASTMSAWLTYIHLPYVHAYIHTYLYVHTYIQTWRGMKLHVISYIHKQDKTKDF